jgi:hypothetical protein
MSVGGKFGSDNLPIDSFITRYHPIDPKVQGDIVARLLAGDRGNIFDFSIEIF